MSLIDLIPEDAPVRVTAVHLAEWFGCSVQTIHRWASNGVLPKPVRIGPKIVRWDREVLRALLKQNDLLAAAAAMKKVEADA